MITPMTKYSFILLNGQQEELVEKLQELGMMDTTRGTKPVDDTSRRIFADIELVSGLIEALNKAEIPAGTVPERIDGDIVRIAGGMIMRYSEDTDAIKALEKEINSTKVWGKFDPDIVAKLKDAGIPLHFHVIGKKLFKQEWADEYALSVVDEDKNSVWFAVAGEDNLPGEIAAPAADVTSKEKELEEKKKHFEKVLARMAGAKERIGELEAYNDSDVTRLELLKLLRPVGMHPQKPVDALTLLL